jgi:hypothetical protein
MHMKRPVSMAQWSVECKMEGITLCEHVTYNKLMPLCLHFTIYFGISGNNVDENDISG